MSTRHQQKAERTFFPRQRRCISESVNNKPSTSQLIENMKHDPLLPQTSSPTRQRYATEVKNEIIETDPEDDDEIIDVLNVEDDVVVDEENNINVKSDRVLEL
jgi:hypothetical protein